MSILLGGSLAAAFAAGMVAFFAPCCAGVMLPAYLAAIGGGRRLRVARLSAIYVAGVSLVVLRSRSVRRSSRPTCRAGTHNSSPSAG